MYKNNLTGNRYGKLVVTRFLYSNRVHTPNNSHTDTYWECLCDCGNKIKVLTRMLNSGDVKSCGCLPVGTPTKEETPLKELYNRYICSAKNKKLSFSLTIDKFAELTKQNCYYCGCEPNKTIENKNKMYSYVYNGIDRLDSLKGYESDNIVSSCWICNRMKLNMSEDEFKSHILKIKNNMNL